jgi:predicted nucleotidyltransferase
MVVFLCVLCVLERSGRETKGNLGTTVEREWDMDRMVLLKSLASFFREYADLYGLEMVFLYGSWAGGQPHAESDVDLAVIFHNSELSDEEVFDRIIDLEAALSTRIKREVNILQIRSDFRKPLLYYNAVVKGEALYAKDFDRYIDLTNEALFQMEDYSLFGIPWQIEMAEKNLEELTHA